MKIPEETICGVCKKIFCCEKCRKKHETKNHPPKAHKGQNFSEKIFENVSSSVDVSCPICQNQALPLRADAHDADLLKHIEQHLPLRCQKCAKIYTKIEELHEFTKCFNAKTTKKTLTEKENLILLETFGNKQTITTTTATMVERKTQLTTISTQTSPMLLGEIKQKAERSKLTQEASLAAMKNLTVSSINNSYNRRSSIGIVALQADGKGKLVRTTSTPVHIETENNKPKEQTFNASGAQVSSIYNSGTELDVDRNSPLPQRPQPQPENLNAYRKFSTRPKIAAVTPLRQVMSKSIQKAFAEHALRSSFEQRKHEIQDACTALTNLPLDLRLSPALRRCQSGSSISFNKNVIREIIETEADFDSDTAVSSTSDRSVYKTCQSLEIIVNEVEIELLEGEEAVDAQIAAVDKKFEIPRKTATLGVNTPITRLPSGALINKKFIKFETPNNVKKHDPIGERFYTPSCENSSKSISSPSTTVQRELIKYSPMPRPSIHDCAQSTKAYSRLYAETIDYDSGDEVFLTPNIDSVKAKSTVDQATQSGNGLIWSFMSSVLQKGTRFLDNKRLTLRDDDEPKAKTSLIKRCASIAGSLVRSNSLVDAKQLQSMKRKRTNTFDSQTSPSSNMRRMDSLPQNLDGLSSSKRFRIQGRKPIERLRNTSL